MNSNNTRYEITVVLLCFLAWGFVFMDRLVISFLMPVIQPALGITNTQVGQLGFATSIFYVISAVFFGVMSDKLGYRKKVIVPLLFLTGVASAAGVFAQTFTQLFIIRCFVGIFEGPMLPLMMSLVQNVSNEKRFGMNAGIVNCGVGAIGTTTGAILVTQLAAHYSWQNTFLLSSLPTFLIAVLFILFIKETKINAKEATKEKVKPMEVFKYRNVIICCFIGILGMCGYWTGMLFAPLYLVNVAKLSVQTMGWIASLMGVLYVIYCFIVPSLSDKFGRRPVMMAAFFLSALSPLAMFLFEGTTSSVVMYVIFGGFAASMTPIYMTLVPMETVPITLLATANAVVMGAGDLFGTAGYPMIAGSIADARGLPFMMLFAAILLFINIFLTCMLKETHPRKQKIADCPNVTA